MFINYIEPVIVLLASWLAGQRTNGPGQARSAM